eukprot:Rmarinus@m.28334
MLRVVLEFNKLSAIVSSNSIRMISSTFRENYGTAQLYSEVYNTGGMEVDECFFEETFGVAAIVSDLPIILRNTFFTDGFSLPYVACDETLELPDGTFLWPCGFNANCTASAYSGVNCT